MKIVCVLNKKKNKYAITVGKEYDVISTEDGKYQIRNDKNFPCSFNKWFFKTYAQIRDDKINLLIK